MNLKYRHALVRNTERRQAELKADYRKFAKARRAERIKDLKTMFLGMLPTLLLVVAVMGVLFFGIKGIAQ